MISNGIKHRIETENLSWDFEADAAQCRSLSNDIAYNLLLPEVSKAIDIEFQKKGYAYLNDWANVSKTITETRNAFEPAFAVNITDKLAVLDKLESSDPDYREAYDGLLKSGLPAKILKSEDVHELAQSYVSIEVLPKYPENVYHKIKAIGPAPKIEHEATEVIQCADEQYRLHHKRHCNLEVDYAGERVAVPLNTDPLTNKFRVDKAAIAGTALSELSQETINKALEPYPRFYDRHQLGEAEPGVDPAIVVKSPDVLAFRDESSGRNKYYEQIREEVEVYNRVFERENFPLVGLDADETNKKCRDALAQTVSEGLSEKINKLRDLHGESHSGGSHTYTGTTLAVSDHNWQRNQDTQSVVINLGITQGIATIPADLNVKPGDKLQITISKYGHGKAKHVDLDKGKDRETIQR